MQDLNDVGKHVFCVPSLPHVFFGLCLVLHGFAMQWKPQQQKKTSVRTLPWCVMEWSTYSTQTHGMSRTVADMHQCVYVDFSALLLNLFSSSLLSLLQYACTWPFPETTLRLDQGQCVCQALICLPVSCGGVSRQSNPRLLACPSTACYLLTPVLNECLGENRSYSQANPSLATELALKPVLNCFLLICSGLLFSVALPL